MVQQESRYDVQTSLFYGSVPHVMGTRFEMVLIDPSPDKADGLWREIYGGLERLDRMFNRFDPGSEVSRVNAAVSATGEAPLSEELEAVLRTCGDYFRKTRGIFDITLQDFSRAEILPGRVRTGQAGLSFDFGGFAKGYALSKVRNSLLREGVCSAFVDFGGSSILSVGHHPYGDCWKVSLPDPYSGRILHEFDLRDSTLSTSGNTVGYHGHIVDPRSGDKNEERMLCSVTGPDPLDAEVLSTTLMAVRGRLQDEILREFNNVKIKIFQMEI